MLAAGSVQEAHDFASHRPRGDAPIPGALPALLRRVPHVARDRQDRDAHDDDLRTLVHDIDVAEHRARGLTPTPVLQTAQNPDVFFQAREASNPFHLAVPGVVAEVMDELAARTGRRYGLVEYTVRRRGSRYRRWGSAAGAVEETVDTLVARGQAVGMVRVRLFHPFPAAQLVAAPSDRPFDRRARPHQGARRRRRAAVPRGDGGIDRGHGRRRAAVLRRTAARRRTLWPVLEGGLAVDDQADLRRARQRPAEAALHGGHLRRRDRPEPAHRPHSATAVRTARCRRCSWVSVRMALWERTRAR